MNRPVLIGLRMALFGLPLLAMAAADFSGSWVQDPKSDRVPDPMWLTRAAPAGRGGRGGGGRAGGPGGRGNPADSITVQQDAGSLQVTDGSGATRKYKLDGKPATMTTETWMAKSAVTASMQGDKLVIGTTRPYGGMPGNVTRQIKEEWALSPDGKTLTITTTDSSPATQKVFKQVYNRK
jgi:hypothetical protein